MQKECLRISRIDIGVEGAIKHLSYIGIEIIGGSPCTVENAERC